MTTHDIEVDRRRQREFAAELLERARAWIPGWELDPANRDFGMALLEIAARFDSEVAQRLDRTDEKTARGLLDWLAIEGEGARAARMPVVLRMAANTPKPVLARAPVKLGFDTAQGPAMFETETDVDLVPGRLVMVVATDAGADAFYLPPPGIENVEPAPPMPQQWNTRAFAAAGSIRLQLDPPEALAPGLLVLAGGRQYRLAAVERELVTLDRPLEESLPAAPVSLVRVFAPFDGQAHSSQLHALYIGDAELLNLEAAAYIDVVGAPGLPSTAQWQYWGKLPGDDTTAWRLLERDEASPPDVLRLRKRPGAVEPHPVEQVVSRWIRAVTGPLEGSTPAFEQLALRINCSPADIDPAPKPAAEETCPFAPGLITSPAIEVVANTTPQVLSGVIHPFGREPRVLDTFYLGCAEAFSKKGALVRMCFDLADPSMRSLAVVPAGAEARMLAGVGQDGFLHLLKFDALTKTFKHLRDPVQPPLPKDAPAAAGAPDGGADTGAAVALDRQLDGEWPARTASWAADGDFFVAAAAKGTVWVWHEYGASGADKRSGWRNYGDPPGGADADARIVDLVSAGANLFAVNNGRLCARPLDGTGSWQALELTPKVQVKAIVPVWTIAGDSIGAPSDKALLAVAADGTLHFVWPSTRQSWALATTSASDRRVRPVALLRPAQNKFELIVIYAHEGAVPMSAFDSTPFEPGVGAPAGTTRDSADLGGEVIGRDLAIAVAAGQITVFAAVQAADGSQHVALWQPFGPDPQLVVALPLTPDDGQAGGAPVCIGQDMVVLPGTKSELLVGKLVVRDFSIELSQEAYGLALFVPLTEPRLAMEDWVVTLHNTANPSYAKVGQVLPGTEETMYLLAFDPAPSAAAPMPYTGCEVYGSGTRQDCTRTGNSDELDLTEAAGTADSILLEYGGKIKRLKIVGGPADADGHRIVTVQKGLPTAAPADMTYLRPIWTKKTVLPWLRFGAAESTRWDASVLQDGPLEFPNLEPRQQDATLVAEADGARWVKLKQAWTRPPGQERIAVRFQGVSMAWNRQLGDAANNPELSWEYWNGSGWWKLETLKDGTRNLRASGMLRFTVPADLQASEWAGKSNYWIRARLVGGDYGRETVTAESSVEGGKTIQQVKRDTSTIHAPAVLHLELRYSLAQAKAPAHLLAQDSGAMRDLGDANRSEGAIVETFVPLGLALQRLQADGGADPGRAVYFGFDARLWGDHINVLLLAAAEHDYDGFAPARVEVLRGGRFEALAATDDTRALGSSGILAFALAAPPPPAALFGRTLSWLRIRPRAGADQQNWQPSLRGAYLNAVWAQAGDTQELEMLGSSAGAPGQQVRLARPPVLHNTLELRVREPLSDEERADLLAHDTASVRANVPGQPGDWVLWQRVPDPADEAGGARVYALDESTGIIRFGDGVHGAIAPIGRDAIMAFRYRRLDAPADPDAPLPANGVPAGSSLGIVTPVAGAEAAFAADNAAGGSGAEDVARVLRFAPSRLRTRGRALTARDLEEMALAALPEVAQARCLRTGRQIQLVVVMRGADPLPTRAQRRELRRVLLEASAPGLAQRGTFDVVAPVLRPFHVSLTLGVDTLDDSAGLAERSRKALRERFGSDWPLGQRPDDNEVAACLLALLRAGQTIDVALTEPGADGARKSLRASLAATELAVLAADDIELRFALLREPA